MSYADLVNEDRRLRMLAILAESAAYVISVDLMQTILSGMGHAVSHDRLATDQEWLKEQGLVELERLGDVPMIRLTVRGLDVANGVAHVPGVARPRPA